MKKTRWIYWKQIFQTKFQASCLKAKLEDHWCNSYDIPPWVEIRKLAEEKYIVRYTFDE